jgi:thiosulfate dehydrogenase
LTDLDRSKAMKNPIFPAAVLLVATLTAGADSQSPTGQQSSVTGTSGDKTVKLCDNKTTVQVPNDAPKTRAEGQRISDALMAQWKASNPNNDWVQGEVEAHQVVVPADNSKLIGTGQSSTYGTVTHQDVQVWKNETYKTAVYGSKVFHSGDELGSEIAVSCDMCHPRAANTHPETYPKFQPQLGRVALLRDMINWCIEHPVRGKVLAPDDPKMRALEAYIIAQRKGTALDYGKR